MDADVAARLRLLARVVGCAPETLTPEEMRTITPERLTLIPAQFAIAALSLGLTAAEIETAEAIASWALVTGPAQRTLTEAQARMREALPRYGVKTNEILQALAADGLVPVWVRRVIGVPNPEE